MKPARPLAFLALCLLAAPPVFAGSPAASSGQKSRIYISDPTQEGPAVIQVHPSSGKVYSAQSSGLQSVPQASGNASAGGAALSGGEAAQSNRPARNISINRTRVSANGDQEPAPSPQPDTAPAADPAATTPRSKPPGQPAPAEAMPPQEPAAPAPKVAAPGFPAPKHSHNNIFTQQPVVAITFDDGPHPELTPKLLDMLKERNIRATFYLIGKNVDAYPEIVRRMVAEGHEVGNHTYTHPALSKTSAARVKAEIDRTNDAIRNAAGVTPRTMRPPYGATNASLNRRLNEEFGLPVIMWSVDPMDWKYRNAARVSGQIIADAKPGDIILAHDIHPSTVAAMPATLDALLAKGFEFVTVTELLSMDGAGDPVREVVSTR